MLGQNLLPIVLEVVKGLNILLEKFNAAPPFVQRMVISFGVLLALAGPTLSFFGTVISGVSGLIGIMGTAGISITTVGTALSTVGSVIFGTVIPAIGAAIVAALPLILALAAIAAGVYFVYWAFKNNFMGITTTAKQLWFIIKYEFNQGWENIKAKSTEGWVQMNDLFKRGSDSIHEIWLKFTQLLQTLLQLLFNWIVEWARTTVQSIFNMFNVDWSQIGSNIINGIINGLRAMWDSLVALAQEIAQSVLDSFDDVMEMGSPSQAMAKRGINSALGYMQGMRNGLNPFVVQQLAAMPLQALDSGSHIQQINHFSRGLTTTQAARMMNDSMPVIMDRLAGMLEED